MGLNCFLSNPFSAPAALRSIKPAKPHKVTVRKAKKSVRKPKVKSARKSKGAHDDIGQKIRRGRNKSDKGIPFRAPVRKVGLPMIYHT